MESTFETLKTLRRLSEKRVRYRHHLSNYRLYRKNKTVPKGLKIKVRAGLPLSDSDSFANWKGILKNASLELMAVQISICRKTIHELSQQIDSKTRKLQKELPKNEFERKLDSISKICLNLSHTLASRQCHKLKRDNVTQRVKSSGETQLETSKRTRSRRFRRKEIQTACNTTKSAVVTIDCQLSAGETNLLSKGLNFCPKPRQVNAQKLSLDLNLFYRRLRLREFFADENGNNTTQQTNDLIPILSQKARGIHPRPIVRLLNHLFRPLKRMLNTHLRPRLPRQSQQN
ncbi:hypothetical protein BSL78_11526 [Apostichopus japonicus]|uniref:Uncharacterized protein n=1 Tax=Stichopus japonicus TaxID=307972 RepID=A0A2G8KU91_STIJA|nr:hypothetical protein BSL78_11526 [Apostichopus japonicus]